MTKKNNSTNIVHKDVLIKSHESFKAELEKRIEIGKEIIERSINNSSEMSKSKIDFNLWDDYNSELLKQSFDRPNNDYHRDYNYSGVSFAFLGGNRPTFSQLVAEHKENINKKLTRLKKILDKAELIESNHLKSKETLILSNNPTQIALEKLNNLFSKFHRIVQTLRNRHNERPTLIIKDEYDVQDLLRALLKEHFEDIREEDYVPSYAGSNSRVDFVLKNEKIIIEVKMTNEKLKDKEVGSQLLIDIGRYKYHPECECLVLFIYDKEDFIINKAGLINDLNKMSSIELKVCTFINPN